MKKLIQTSVIVVVLAAQIEPAIAGQKKMTDYFKPSGSVAQASSRSKRQAAITDYFHPLTRVSSTVHAGAPDHSTEATAAAAAAHVPTTIHDLPMEILSGEVAAYLDPVSLARFSQTHRDGREAANQIKAQAFKREFAKVNLLTLPEVTQADVAHLEQARVETSIRAPLRSFKISDTPISIGLYHAMMGHYPDLSQSHWPSDPGERDALRVRWQANPDLPLTNTTVAEDQAFIAALNARTGRHFRLPSASEVEYSIRGRSQGAITTTRYHFGDDDHEVPNRAWIDSNSGDQAHGVREPLPGRTLENSKNSFGLIHPIGNVCVRSAEGVVRGGSFADFGEFTQSSFRDGGDAGCRYADIGARLVEDL